MEGVTIGFAVCGSFCTFSKAIQQMKMLSQKGYNILPIMSYTATSTDTRFGKANDFIDEIENICKNKIIKSIVDAEPIGPEKLADIILIAPCTGNTLGKISNAITDTPVTMAVKSHLRIQRPLLIALSSNDALGASAQNIGKLLNTKNIYFVPMTQDDPSKKPNSLVANFDLIPSAIESTLNHKQIQPIFY